MLSSSADAIESLDAFLGGRGVICDEGLFSRTVRMDVVLRQVWGMGG